MLGSHVCFRWMLRFEAWGWPVRGAIGAGEGGWELRVWLQEEWGRHAKHG